MATHRVVVEGSNVSASQLSDLFRQIGDGSLNRMHIQALLERRNPFDLDGVVIDWIKVYKVLGMKLSFTSEDLADTSHWAVPVGRGLTPNQVVKALRDSGVDVYIYTNDLDKSVPTNDLDSSNGSYIVRFQKTIEADPELKDKSAEMLAKENIKGITILERLLLELGYFLATGNHLDMKNVTLCAGSRHSGGHVPSVHWLTDDRKLYVNWDGTSNSYSSLRTRAVVSTTAK